MVSAPIEDLLALDRDVARGASSLARWREALARDPEAFAAEEPLEAVRRVAGKSTWDALAALSPSAADGPLRDALRVWVYALTQARIGRDQDVAWAQAAGEASGVLDVEVARKVSWREAWRGVVASKGPAEARQWLDAAAGAGPKLAAIASAQAARRVEVARRFGLEHPWSPLVAVPAGELRRSAKGVLDATEELSRAVWREALGADRDAPATLDAAMGRAAAHGWPAHITARWIEGVIAPGGRGVRVEVPALPAAAGASSFARALRAFGYSVRASIGRGAPGSSGAPFAVAREPAFVAAHRLSFVFGALPADPAWQMQALGVVRRTALAQARVLARTALLDVRLHAARILLGDDAMPAPRDAFDEIGVRLFGAPVDARLRGAWPRARDDEPARWVGLLQAGALAATLRDLFDADWYRNPRAWAHLHAIGATPARDTVWRSSPEDGAPVLPAGTHALDPAAIDDAVRALARSLEVALG
jgi:hypothetical protein